MYLTITFTITGYPFTAVGWIRVTQSTLKNKYTLHTHGYGLKKEDTCTMSDIETFITFFVYIPILHFIYITEDWNEATGRQFCHLTARPIQAVNVQVDRVLHNMNVTIRISSIQMNHRDKSGELKEKSVEPAPLWKIGMCYWCEL
jgi:diaminopimelate epimerase